MLNVHTAFPSDNFPGQGAAYTETLALTKGDGTGYTGAFVYTQTTIPPFPMGTQYTRNANLDARVSLVTLSGTTYTVTITLLDKNGNPLSAWTNTTQTPMASGTTSTIVGSGGGAGVTLIVTETLTSSAVAAALAPFMQIDLTTLTCVMSADINWYNSSTIGISGQTGSIYFNTRLYELFAGFPFKFFGYSGDKNYQVLTTSNSYSNVLTVSNQGTGTT